MTEQIIIGGTITATSNKEETKFQAERPKITAYVAPATLADKEELIKAGMTCYSSKNGDEFFIIKLGKEINVYDENTQELVAQLDGGRESGTLFKMKNPGKLAIFKSENKGNDVYRITDILTKADNLEKIERLNPFI